MATVLRRPSPWSCSTSQPVTCSHFDHPLGLGCRGSRGAPEDQRADGERVALARDRGRPGRRED